MESPLFHVKPTFDLGLDIAICKVNEHALIGAYQPLNIGFHQMKIGDRAVAIGYAEMQNFKVGLDNPEPELFVSVGKVTNVYPDNMETKDIPTPGPAFEFDAKIPGKMSGGPILVGSGILAKGVVSRSWQNEAAASGCLVGPILGIPLGAVGKSLRELTKDGTEGIAEVFGHDI